MVLMRFYESGTFQLFTLGNERRFRPYLWQLEQATSNSRDRLLEEARKDWQNYRKLAKNERIFMPSEEVKLDWWTSASFGPAPKLDYVQFLQDRFVHLQRLTCNPYYHEIVDTFMSDFVKINKSARIIRDQFRKCRYNTEYFMCRRILISEHRELFNVGEVLSNKRPDPSQLEDAEIVAKAREHLKAWRENYLREKQIERELQMAYASLDNLEHLESIQFFGSKSAEFMNRMHTEPEEHPDVSTKILIENVTKAINKHNLLGDIRMSGKICSAYQASKFASQHYPHSQLVSTK